MNKNKLTALITSLCLLLTLLFIPPHFAEAASPSLSKVNTILINQSFMDPDRFFYEIELARAFTGRNPIYMHLVSDKTYDCQITYTNRRVDTMKVYIGGRHARTVRYSYNSSGLIISAVCTEKNNSNSQNADLYIAYSQENGKFTQADCTRITDAGSTTSTYTYNYDTNGRLTALSCSDGSSTSFSWSNNVLQSRSGSNAASMTLDSMGRPTSERTASGTILFTYDDSGNLLKISGAAKADFQFSGVIETPEEEETEEPMQPTVPESTSPETPETTLPADLMTDLQNPNDWYYAAGRWSVNNNISTGTSKTTFSPTAPCTRGQLVTFLWKIAGSPEPKSASPFTDVPSTSYCAKSAAWAFENGITSGVTATSFAPNRTITREETVALLYRFAGNPTFSGSKNFTDVSSTAWYYTAVQWGAATGVVSGTSSNRFGVKQPCTRAAAVTFLYRLLVK